MIVETKTLALAVLLASTQSIGAAGTQEPVSAAAPPTQSAAVAPPAPIAIARPDDWIVYDDSYYTPVVDEVSRHLALARTDFADKDRAKAAAELHTVAADLAAQAKFSAGIDRARSAAEMTRANDSARRVTATSIKVDAAASAMSAGKITTAAQLDRAIDPAARADMDQRWLDVDVATWYPVSEEPQRHFTDAAAAYARQDFKEAAADIRKAAGYMRLESSRATGAAGKELSATTANLEALAGTVDRHAVKDNQSLDLAFARADHALALAHRTRASADWVRSEYVAAGYELKAAAQGTENSAAWVGGEASAGASATVADARSAGDKLASGATWTRDEVSKDIEALGGSIDALGEKIAGNAKKT